MKTSRSALLTSFDGMAPEPLEIYRDLHQQPGLSRQELGTSGLQVMPCATAAWLAPASRGASA